MIKKLLTREFILQFIFAAIFWYIITGEIYPISNFDKLYFASIILFTAIIGTLYAPIKIKNIKIHAALRFIPFFMTQSFSGGIDVAKRAFSPKVKLKPLFIKYKLKSNHYLSNVLFASSISLFPGTISAKIEEDYLLLHILHDDKFGGKSTATSVQNERVSELSAFPSLKKAEDMCNNIFKDNSSIKDHHDT